ncbi:4-hydroxybenzoate polyprenyltransferase [Geoglobus ahangari]|uniref:4-hydroxybenzoate polyprenyltransferase n=1 Tax=Geoglobus ahangari TaxID=113653 RepID=A0A0F7IHC0_9EURY|nr:UbiA-like polyprenyltransferase [Geoglobus ahangari]AKG92342.1 4-hydroxybenzoate polyprenyltransferase [Geoglobus ahangari]NOY11282.1 4-hydroxybenzoate octaprenyltransferase [Archaeoglobi archaeon]
MIKKLGLIMDFIKIEHTLFALPFAYLGAFLAQNGLISLRTFILIATAFTGLRTAAMSLNRIIDREIDALNPRTASRHIPAGLISLREAYAIVAISLAVYFVSAYLINETAFILSPIPVITAYVYPYLKRFTVLSHYVLGLNLAFAPMGGWIAVTNSFDFLGKDMLAFLIGVAVIFWVAGFDMIYALQDYDFDRKHGLHSFPARFGIRASKAVAFINHIAFFSILSYAMLHVYSPGLFVRIGLATILAIIIAEHLIVNLGKDEKAIQIAFFYMNAALSSVLLVFTFLDVLL